ncbi:uncharacterized protein LOC122401156 [Colletes gigas]|uniref:uncharacterized protein LOC122401156 n=1 Tax=Colletes gigas TaxID=935657 RepID=UPI001C9AE304|nr:uncharacterized protein LOC122401156 [Colletes gigas]
MATAIIQVLDRDRKPIECRTLIDTCSTANFITDDLATRLRLPAKENTTTIEASNQLNTIANKLVSTTIKSRHSNYQRELTFFTIPRIAGPIPDEQIDRSRITIPANIKLADPQFHQPAQVDMLIGTGPTLSSLSIGQHRLSPRNGPDLVLQKTQFGWIIGGNVSTTATRNKQRTLLTTPTFDLQRFWELEEVPETRHLSFEERQCEQHFEQQLGESRSRALNRLFPLERRFQRDPELKREYSDVIKEYLDLGHMSEVEPRGTEGFYLPHHAVIKPTSTTTKIRVVFDGSARSSTGLSLNDTLLTGPTIQDDIFALLVRFRSHTHVLTGDIEKMYRQFLIRPEDRRYQRILWRDNDDKIKTYELNTVTFGLSPAPFLAIRSIQQLADDERVEAPVAATVLQHDLYVDDLLTGADTYTEAINLRKQTIRLLKLGGLHIRQWASNEPRLLTGLPEAQIHTKYFGDATVKTLGVSWHARDDHITYSVDPNIETRVTKRTILSTIAKIFDPLGLLVPVITTAKQLMQQLWQLQLAWDESLPASIHTEWTTYVKELPLLNRTSFERHVCQRAMHAVELHGFCDASERAYGACLYVRSIDELGHIKTKLLCAKSRVAPLKVVSLARLELCGAVLLASLVSTIHEINAFNFDSVRLWTDSTVVLSWLRKEPCTLKTFVANRVSEIQQKTDIAVWHHVQSGDNPADLISRGQSSAEFLNDSLWRHGPAWLANNVADWPKSRFIITSEVPETRSRACFATTIVRSEEILNRYSNIAKLRRIVTYCLRFKKGSRREGTLSAEEIHYANEQILRIV